MDLDQLCLSEYGSRITHLYRWFELCGRSYLLTSSSTRDGWVRRGVGVGAPYRDVVRRWGIIIVIVVVVIVAAAICEVVVEAGLTIKWNMHYLHWLLLRLSRLELVLAIMA